ncbi:very short patch repair endonuclease [Agrobacterium sp. LMR679]|uniref:very short patch repair endonuclease n=1 Tax=Agrobacterium sp. LMR679 TaxID=3014335 RepID=UPI0022AFC8FF|nr:very short patch repair endonuclease [Agrobacterium sp. LMR679]MCZ4074952.1 very short patch repair endonuclease [Agrobacterium sp. LMR679]
MDEEEQNVSQQRRRNMQAVRSRDTKPEIAVRKLLHRLGYRFRLQRSDLPGKPDIVLPRHRLAVFVHGCFWHRHNCKRATMPKTRTTFWEAKLSANVDRDARAMAALGKLGWRTVVIWECEIGDHQLLSDRINIALEPGTN